MKHVLFTLVVAAAAIPGCKGKKSKTPEPKSRVEKKLVEEEVTRRKTSKLIEFANADLKKGRYISAAKRAEEALAENPQNADAHAILGAARWRAGDYQASTEAYEKAVELDEKNFGAVLGLASNLQAAGNHARALEILDKLVAEDKAQIDPRLYRLWSYYPTVQADKAVSELDELFNRMPADDPQLPLVQAYAAFVRPLAGKGDLCVVEGESGSMDSGVNHDVGMKYGSGIVGGEFSRVVFFENVEEAVVDKELVATLGLKSLGKITPLGLEEETDIVIVPEIKFGDLALKNVPAVVQPLDPYTEALGEKPGLILGRQAMQAFGSITFDFPARSLNVTKAAPEKAPDGTVEVPLLMLSMKVRNAPAIPVTIDGSDHEFFVYFGGIYASSVAFTKKEYLKSGHLPREVAEPEDKENGFKMVYVNDVAIGEAKLGGTGGLVLVNTPADTNLDILLQGTGFELGGYINTRVMAAWAVTYAIGTGKLYLKLPS